MSQSLSVDSEARCHRVPGFIKMSRMKSRTRANDMKLITQLIAILIVTEIVVSDLFKYASRNATNNFSI